MKLNIMTYNIASGRDYAKDSDITAEGGSKTDLSRCAEVIKDISPDLCGLNEVNNFEEEYAKNFNGRSAADQTKFIAEFTGLNSHFFGRAIHLNNRGDYGNAVISKYPIISSEVIPIPDPEVQDEDGGYESRSITKVKLDVAGGITILQVHVGLRISQSELGINTLCRVIDETEGPIIVMGDFNMRPSNELFNKIKARLNEIAPDGEGYHHTFPSWTYEANVPEKLKKYRYCKIDHIFASKEFKKISCNVHKVRVSDHMPLIATLEI